MKPVTFDFTGTSSLVINPNSMPNGGTPLLANQLIHILGHRITVSAATKITIQDQTGLVLDILNFGAASGAVVSEGEDPACAPATPGSGIQILSSNSVEVTGTLNIAIKGFP
jgi:hypothetical protein